MSQVPALQWFADPDGVHRLREGEGFSLLCRAMVQDFEMSDASGWIWRGFIWSNHVTLGTEPTLELAKAAAERAVKQLDEEGL